ncbi:MAG: right-handed parallel beta-helix repeat-containing protein, partial [Bacteroidota bacterium]
MRQQPDYIPRTNFGYFIQNHINTLDQSGEWAYDKNLQDLYVYSQDNFAQAKIRYTYTPSLINIRRQTHLIIQNLKLMESNEMGIDLYKSHFIVMSHLVMEDMGEKGIQSYQSDHIQIKKTLIRRAYDVAASLNGNNYQIVNNQFYDIGLVRGMGFNYGALVIDVDDMLFESNRIKDVGYIGLNFSGDDVLIQKNEISHVCRILDDGGGIYTFNGFEKRNADNNRIVRLNYIHDVFSALDGAGYSIPLSCGVYLDSGVRNVEVSQNTIRDCQGAGVYVHNAIDNQILSNNLYFNVSGIDVTDDNTSSIRCRNNLVKDNKVLMIAKGLQSIRVSGTKDTGDFRRLAEIDHNFYSDPFYNSRVRYAKAFGDLGVLTLDKWKSIHQMDANSKGTPVIYPPFLVDSYLDDNLIKNGSFDKNWKEWICQKDCEIQVDSSQIEFSHNRAEDALWEYVEFYQDIDARRTGVYEISFRAKAELKKKNIYFYLRQNKEPYKKISD